MKKFGLIPQLYMLVLAAIVVIGVITQVSEFQIQSRSVKAQMAERAVEAATDTFESLKEYPAYEWLLRYWAAHADDLEVEYDAGFTDGTVTEEKIALLLQRHPDLRLHYCTEEELEALSEEDRRLYAEIAYAWILNRFNSIKKTFECDFLYCVVTDTDEGAHPYETKTWLLSAAEPGTARGTAYKEAYTLGTSISIADDESEQALLRQAVEAAPASREGDLSEYTVGETLKHAGNYLDHYTCLTTSKDTGQAFLIGSTYEVADVNSQIHRSALKETLISMLYQFLLLNLIVGYLMMFTIHPLKRVLESIRSYTDNKDSKAVEANLKGILSERGSFAIRHNEIGQLAVDFTALTNELENYTTQIRRTAAEKERIMFELETAAQIQLSMLPDGNPAFPDHPEFELCASMTPAKMVGGDFYDYFLVDDSHLALVMADVSDKGIPAALFMAEAKALIKSRIQAGTSPAEALTHVNDQLCETNTGKCFVTVWLAIIDLITGEGVAANAGHEHPALCKKGGSFELVLYKHSPVVGMMEGISFKEHTFKLDPGDRIYVYTDGVPEASNEQQEQFGTDRMLKALNVGKNLTPGRQLEMVSSAIDAFMGEADRFDDTTMMCFAFKGARSGKQG